MKNPPEKGTPILDVLFACDPNCPVIKQQRALGGAIAPKYVEGLVTTAAEDGYEVRDPNTNGEQSFLYRNRCTALDYNGLDGRPGRCFLLDKGATPIAALKTASL